MGKNVDKQIQMKFDYLRRGNVQSRMDFDLPLSKTKLHDIDPFQRIHSADPFNKPSLHHDFLFSKNDRQDFMFHRSPIGHSKKQYGGLQYNQSPSYKNSLFGNKDQFDLLRVDRPFLDIQSPKAGLYRQKIGDRANNFQFDFLNDYKNGKMDMDIKITPKHKYDSKLYSKAQKFTLPKDSFIKPYMPSEPLKQFDINFNGYKSIQKFQRKFKTDLSSSKPNYGFQDRVIYKPKSSYLDSQFIGFEPRSGMNGFGFSKSSKKAQFGRERGISQQVGSKFSSGVDPVQKKIDFFVPSRNYGMEAINSKPLNLEYKQSKRSLNNNYLESKDVQFNFKPGKQFEASNFASKYNFDNEMLGAGTQNRMMKKEKSVDAVGNWSKKIQQLRANLQGNKLQSSNSRPLLSAEGTEKERGSGSYGMELRNFSKFDKLNQLMSQPKETKSHLEDKQFKFTQGYPQQFQQKPGMDELKLYGNGKSGTAGLSQRTEELMKRFEQLSGKGDFEVSREGEDKSYDPNQELQQIGRRLQSGYTNFRTNMSD